MPWRLLAQVLHARMGGMFEQVFLAFLEREDRDAVAAEAPPGSWRTGRDSNPRWLLHHARFPSVCLKPLGHLSSGMVGRPYSALPGLGNGIFPRRTGVR